MYSGEWVVGQPDEAGNNDFFLIKNIFVIFCFSIRKFKKRLEKKFFEDLGGGKIFVNYKWRK